MENESSRPIIFLAFANDRDDSVGYLRQHERRTWMFNRRRRAHKRRERACGG